MLELPTTSVPPAAWVSKKRVIFTQQGEGPTAGKDVLLFRLNECNLQCTWCDTKETWLKTDPTSGYNERVRWDLEQAEDEILRETQGRCRRLMITGGEPLLQQRFLALLCDRPALRDWDVEIETNGTIEPIRFRQREKLQINCSPKLANSGMDLSKRQRPKVLRALADHYHSYFKFVVANAEDVKELVRDYVPILQVDPSRIWLSPMGTTTQELDASKTEIRESAHHHGFSVGDRLHIRRNIP